MTRTEEGGERDAGACCTQKEWTRGGMRCDRGRAARSDDGRAGAVGGRVSEGWEERRRRLLSLFFFFFFLMTGRSDLL